MELLNHLQRQDALEQARLLAGDKGRAAEVAQLALQLEDELEHLLQLLRKTEHYLESGQQAEAHAHLLRDLQHYRFRFDRKELGDSSLI